MRIWTDEEFSALKHEYDPEWGNLGRGQLVPLPDFLHAAVPDGWAEFSIGGPVHRIQGPDGSPTVRIWRAWTREVDGKHYAVCLEATSVT